MEIKNQDANHAGSRVAWGNENRKKLRYTFSSEWQGRTVNAVWTVYAALYNHLTATSKDVNRNSSERYVYEGLAAKLSSVAFVKDLVLMMDALGELKDPSKALQSRDIRLSQSVSLTKNS